MDSLRTISLFSGAAGLDRGVARALARRGIEARTVCYVEGDAYACAVLAARMEDGRLDAAPVWSDVRTFDGRPWRGVVDCIVGGFPCQDISLAGKGAGIAEGTRSGLWLEFARIVREVGPRFVFVENVGALITRGLDLVLGDLAALGFDAEWGCLRASDVGAPHERERVFLLAYADGAGLRDESGRERGAGWAGDAPVVEHAGADMANSDRDGLGVERRGGVLDGQRAAQRHDADGRDADVGDATRKRRRKGRPESVVRGGRHTASGAGGDVGDADHARLEGRRRVRERANERPAWPPGPSGDWSGWRGPQPAIRRDADGLANRVDRLRLCGNGVVVEQAAVAFDLLATRAGLW